MLIQMALLSVNFKVLHKTSKEMYYETDIYYLFNTDIESCETVLSSNVLCLWKYLFYLHWVSRQSQITQIDSDF